jgi:hypothetical protein
MPRGALAPEKFVWDALAANLARTVAAKGCPAQAVSSGLRRACRSVALLRSPPGRRQTIAATAGALSSLRMLPIASHWITKS